MLLSGLFYNSYFILQLSNFIYYLYVFFKLLEVVMKVLRYCITTLKVYYLVVIIIINNVYKLFNEITGYKILKLRRLMRKICIDFE
jgi:hypothetical protein